MCNKQTETTEIEIQASTGHMIRTLQMTNFLDKEVQKEYDHWVTYGERGTWDEYTQYIEAWSMIKDKGEQTGQPIPMGVRSPVRWVDMEEDD